MSYTGKTPDIVKRKLNYQGIPIHIEWNKGDVRAYSDGYRKLMQCHYGFIPNIVSSYDGDEIDVFLGESSSDTVYAFNQLKNNLTGIDEIKFMLGFSDKGAASRMFAAHVGTSRFGGYAFSIKLSDFKNMIDLLHGKI